MKIFLFSFQGALFASKYIIRGGMRMSKKWKMVVVGIAGIITGMLLSYILRLFK